MYSTSINYSFPHVSIPVLVHQRYQDCCFWDRYRYFNRNTCNIGRSEWRWRVCTSTRQSSTMTVQGLLHVRQPSHPGWRRLDFTHELSNADRISASSKTYKRLGETTSWCISYTPPHTLLYIRWSFMVATCKNNHHRIHCPCRLTR